MPFIPEDTIEQILSRVDIVETISNFLPLKRSGRNFKALCPFHSEKTPSFIVSPARQIYHCFGCGQGGNVFSFIMQYEKITFQEACELLANKAGVELPKTVKGPSKSLSIIIYEINELACKWYENNLSSDFAVGARQYLKNRGIKETSIKEFRLGFAPGGLNSLLNFLRQKGYALNVLEKTGLIVPRAEGGYRDVFRNRIIFPILDIRDRVIGFGARVLDDSLPKYINSPETPVYTKGRQLYGLNKAKGYINEKDFVIVVEGYLDLITLKQEGIGCVVSSLGTALTEEQAGLIKRFTNNVIMIFDPDKAGQLATLRTLEIFIKEDMNVKVVVLSEGFDPDSFVRGQGVNKFLSLIASAEDLFSYKLKVLKTMFDINQIHGKADIVREMLNTINCFRNEVIKSEYIRRLSQELNVAEEALKIEIKKINSPTYKISNRKISQIPAVGYTAVEKLLLRILLEDTSYISRLKDRIQPSDFQDRRFASLVNTLFELSDKERFLNPHQLINYFLDSDISSLISELISKPEPLLEDKDKVLNECIQRIKQSNIKTRLHKLHEDIILVKDNPKELNRLMEEYNSLMKLAGNVN